MIAQFGEDDDSWIGVTIELFAGKAKYNGDLTDSVLVKPVTAKSSAATPKTTERRTDDNADLDVPFLMKEGGSGGHQPPLSTFHGHETQSCQ